MKKITTFFWRGKYILLFFFLFIIVLTQRFLNEKQSGLANTIATDGVGYYTYLPSAIIYQDFSYAFYDKAENKIKREYNPYCRKYKDQYPLNKYYCGTSICLLPFFLIGITISAIAGTNINGYTDTFLMLVSIATIFYFLLSTFLLTRIARYFLIPEKTGLWASLIFFFATNLFHYVVQEPSMSHSYSFFAVTLFFYTLTQVIQNTTTKNILYLSLSLGLVVLIRPPNVIIILFIPFFFSSLKEFWTFFTQLFSKHWLALCFAIIAFFACIFIQLFFYYLQTGNFIVESYPGETFNFSHPEIFNILFSYKKGLFLYTPIILAAIIFILIGKKNWFKRIVFLVTFSIFTYITASWWCWYYGGGFSGRPFIDIYPLFIITIIVLYNKLNNTVKKIITIICIPFVFVNQIMAYQYSNLIIDAGYMDEEKYWDTFLKTDLATINDNKINKIIKGKSIIATELMNYENDGNDSRVVNIGYISNKSSIVGKTNYYSKGFEISLKAINATPPFYVIVECMAKHSKEGKNLGLVISVDKENNTTLWAPIFITQFNQNTDGWTRMSNIIRIDSNLIDEKSHLKIFANTEFGENYVDDLKYTIVK